MAIALILKKKYGSLSVTCDVTFSFEITSACRPWLKNVSCLRSLLILILILIRATVTSIQIAKFVSQSLYSIPRFRRADLHLNLHLYFLLSGRYKYLHQDFAMKVVSCGSFVRWCCCGKKMAVYFKYFCAGNYRFPWEYLSSKGVSAHIALRLTFTLFHTRVGAMSEIVYLTRSDVIDRIRNFAIKPFVDCFSLQAVVHS